MRLIHLNPIPTSVLYFLLPISLDSIFYLSSFSLLTISLLLAMVFHLHCSLFHLSHYSLLHFQFFHSRLHVSSISSQYSSFVQFYFVSLVSNFFCKLVPSTGFFSVLVS